MDNIDLDALASNLGFVLKLEQKEAVELLLKRKQIFQIVVT